MSAHADKFIAQAAQDVIAKIISAIPDHLRCFLLEPSVGAKPGPSTEEENIDCAVLRSAIHQGRKLRLRYRSDSGAATERVVRPILLGCADTHRMLIVWCELRADFRHFRTDRIAECMMLDATIGEPPGALRRRWEARRLAEFDTARRLGDG